MPYKTPELAVNPSVLEWARKTAGFTSDDIAKRLSVSKEQVELWEKGSQEVPLRVTQLEDLAHFLRRPLAAFLLDKPPIEPEPPRDFRRVGGESGPLSPSLKLVIRRARRLQRIAHEVMENMGIAMTSQIPSAKLQDKPEMVGRRLRKSFNVTTQEQFKWRSPSMALNHWRETLEARNILVFQGDFEREEAQGFSISDEHPYAIILSSKDYPNARSFTLLHELGHLLLREGGVCLTEIVYPSRETKITKTENWCHRFAEAFLIDEDILHSKEETEYIIKMTSGYEDKLQKLASQFKVSREVILFKLWHDKSITDSLFWSMYSQLQQKLILPTKREEKKKEGGPSQVQIALRERGRFFSRLILDALDRNILGYTDAADYLSVRPRDFERLRSMT